jgi:hypothetical protein
LTIIWNQDELGRRPPIKDEKHRWRIFSKESVVLYVSKGKIKRALHLVPWKGSRGGDWAGKK